MPGVERNYHIFYWLLTGAFPDYAREYSVPIAVKYRIGTIENNVFYHVTCLASISGNTC